MKSLNDVFEKKIADLKAAQAKSDSKISELADSQDKIDARVAELAVSLEKAALSLEKINVALGDNVDAKLKEKAEAELNKAKAAVEALKENASVKGLNRALANKTVQSLDSARADVLKSVSAVLPFGRQAAVTAPLAEDVRSEVGEVNDSADTEIAAPSEQDSNQ